MSEVIYDCLKYQKNDSYYLAPLLFMSDKNNIS